MSEEDKYKNVSSSSLVNLKAELFRKQQEFREAKLRGATTKPTKVPGKKSVWNTKNPGVAQRSEKDIEEKTEEDNALDKSRQMLEAKAALYEKLSKGNKLLDDDMNERFLVDFDRKPDMPATVKIESSTDHVDDEDIPSAAHPGEEWVEYTDSFGRTRKCMRQDLPQFEAKDNQRRSESGKDVEEAQAGVTDVPSEPAGPLHYQNVRYNEIRNHGVGYFGFSKDEVERQKQMELLNNLRGKTVDEIKKRENLLEKRKTAMEARLAKVREKKLLSMGLPADILHKSGEKSNQPDEALTEPAATCSGTTNQSEQVAPPVSEAADAGTKPNTKDGKMKIRPWDIGKVDLNKILLAKRKSEPMSQEQWIKKQREERNEDFAPPQSYNTDISRKRPVHSKPQTTHDELFKQSSYDTFVQARREERPTEFAPPTSYDNFVPPKEPVTINKDNKFVPPPYRFNNNQSDEVSNQNPISQRTKCENSCAVQDEISAKLAFYKSNF